jgi:hypothetical protein
MFTKIKRHKKILLLVIMVFVVSFIYLYQVSRPTIIFHTHTESGYLGKVSTFDGSIDKLYIKNYTAQYRLPHIWNWKEDDEIAIFTSNYNDLFQKENIDFWKQDIFLDENGCYVSHLDTPYFWSK